MSHEKLVKSMCEIYKDHFNVELDELENYDRETFEVRLKTGNGYRIRRSMDLTEYHKYPLMHHDNLYKQVLQDLVAMAFDLSSRSTKTTEH